MIRKRNLLGLTSNRKGFIEVTFMIVIVLIIFAIVAVTMGRIMNDVNEFMQDDDDLSNNSKQEFNNLTGRYSATFDGAFALIFALLFIVGMAASWVSNSNPLFFVVAILIMIFLLLAGAIFSNVWDDYTNDPYMSQNITDYTVTNWVLDNYVLVVLAMISTMIFVMYMRNRGTF